MLVNIGINFLALGILLRFRRIYETKIIKIHKQTGFEHHPLNFLVLSLVLLNRAAPAIHLLSAAARSGEALGFAYSCRVD